jgi:hypothetical protein
MTMATSSGSYQAENNVAITTVGAGVLTAAAITAGLITRSGSTAAYSDTTDTAAAIIAAVPTPSIAQSWKLTIKNTVAFPQTLVAGVGVTLAGLTVIPPLSVGVFLVTLDSATGCTLTGVSMAPLCNLPPTKFTTNATDTTIAAAAGDLTGANHVIYRTTAVGAGGIALTPRTPAQMFADIPNAQIGMSYLLTIASEGGGTVTLQAVAGITYTGTSTIATKVTRTFVVTFTSATAVTFQSVSTGAIE